MFQNLSPEFQSLIASLLVALVGIFLRVLVLLVAQVTQLVLTKVAVQKAKLSQQQLWTIESAIEWAVKAAEQLGINEQLENLAQTKKAWVINLVQAFADEKGIKVDVATIEAILEAKIKDGVHKGTGDVPFGKLIPD